MAAARQRHNERKRANRQRNLEQYHKMELAWRERHREQERKRGLIYYHKNARILSEKRKVTVREMCKAVYDILGRYCKCCGFSDMRALQIDHVNGFGNKERRKLSSSSPAFYKKIIAAAGYGYQVLCANCNWIKAREEGSIPILEV